MSSQTDALISALTAAWRDARPLSPAEAFRLAPPTAAAAYRVQDGVAAALGWFPAGRPRVWKMGAADRNATPAASPLPEASVLASPALLPAHGLTMTGIEGELAVRLGAPLAPGCSPAEAAAAVGEIFAAIEVCDRRAAGDVPPPPLFDLADRQVNRCLVLGERIAGPWRPELATQLVSLEVDGTLRQQHPGGHPLEDPLYLLPWLAAHVAGRVPGGLAAGDLVTCGSWTGLYRAHPGTHAVVRFARVGAVEVSLAAAD